MTRRSFAVFRGAQACSCRVPPSRKRLDVAWRLLRVCAAVASILVFALSGDGQDSATPRPKAGDRATAGAKQQTFNSAIQYIIFIIKENRSFDGYFGTYPGAFGASQGTISTGQVIPLFHAGDRYSRDFDHSWQGLVQSIDYGRMDDFDLPQQLPCSINGDYLCYSQAYQQDLPNYWTYAQNFVLGDEMFSSEPGPTYPQHIYAVAASSGGVIAETTASNGEDPGCDSPPGTTVNVLSLTGNITEQYPCFDMQTLGDSLDAADIPWRYYGAIESVWNGYLSINHIRHSSDWTNDVLPGLQFQTDVGNSQLPAVSWLVPSDVYQSEHPDQSICDDENWTVEQINAVMNSPYWANAAIFVTWDDPDGIYDHLPPPIEDEYGLGPRVPLLIISPYAKAGYISHTVYEPSSILKFIEERYNLPYLTNRDANANDMLDSFDFNQAPLPPLLLQTRSCPVVSQLSTSFLSQQVGTTSPSRTILLTNYGSTPLTISNMTTTAGFAQMNNCNGSLAADPLNPPDCTIQVTFSPTASGPETGTVTITDSDPSSPQVVQLSGTGTNVLLSPALLSFGTETVGSQSAAKTATLTNEGTAPVTINSITATPDYQVTNTCGSSLPAQGQCTLAVVFKPTTTGKRYGPLTVNTSDAGSPMIVNMTGVGSEVSLSPSTINFGNEPVGSASQGRNVTLTNKGTTPLAINSITFVGDSNHQPVEDTADFSQTNTCGSTVAAGKSCKITVVFSPAAFGSRSATLNISDAYADSPQQMNLSGTGVASLNHPVPFLDEVSPPSGTVGSASLSLTVYGTGFTSGSTVDWNGTALATTYVSSYSLQTTVPAPLLAQAGTARVTVVDPAPGGGVSNVYFFSVASPESSVGFSRSDVAVGTTPIGVVAADFNGDGIEDLALANSASNTISILLGQGNGTFMPATSPTTGNQPVSLAAGDFNNDGKVDLAVGDLADNTVTVLLGNGDGTFGAAASICSTVSPVSIAAGDFNGDGYLDVAVANYVEPEVSILLGDGTGALTPASTPSGEGKNPAALVLGGFNASGYLSLAEVNSSDLTLVSLLGNGNGTFQVSTGKPPSTGRGPVAMAAGDFNEDGVLDLAVANQTDNTVSIYFGIGNGAFQSGVTYGVGAGPNSVAVADLNRDGVLDLVISNQEANTVSVLLGRPGGTFAAHADYPVGAVPAGVVIADWNGDGRLDPATTNSGAATVSVMLQGGPAKR